MRGVSAGTTLWTSAIAVALAWTGVGSAATTRVTPASGERGSHAVLVGSGFRAHKTVSISLGGARVGKLKTDGRGAFRLGFDVPGSSGLHAKRLVASDNRRTVRNSFTVTRRSPALGSSMTADSGGTRLRLSPVAGEAGATVHVAGWDFPHGGVVRVFFGPDMQGQPETVSSKGRFRRSFEAPDISPGRHAVSARSTGSSLSAPFRLRSTPPPPNGKGSWTTAQPMPAEILDAGSAVVAGKLYSVAGKTTGGHLRSMRIYDPSKNQWSSAPSLPASFPAVENPAVVALNGKIYVFGGSEAPFSNAVANAAVFDPGSGSWNNLPSMPSARGGATAQASGGKIYVVGGMDSAGTSLASVLVYDVSGKNWSSGPSLSTKRDNPGSAVLSGKDGTARIYVFGGRTMVGGTNTVDGTLSSVEYLESGSWKPRASMPTGRRTMAVGTLNGRAQLAGGEQPTMNENEEYDPRTDTWRTLTSMPTGRHGASFGTISGKFYVAGGAVAKNPDTDVNEVFSFGG